MPLDYAAVREGRAKVADIVAGVRPNELHRLTHDMFDQVEAIVGDATDAEVVFTPIDRAVSPEAPGWSIAHVICHLTAGFEESAALGSQLARGAEVTGRSRFETDWETITTAKQLRQRLAESRRICANFLNTWPDQPNLDLTYLIIERFGPLNAVARHVMGVMHADSHLEQLRDARRQARSA